MQGEGPPADATGPPADATVQDATTGSKAKRRLSEEEMVVEKIKLSCFERTIVRHPCKCCWGWFAFAMLWVFMCMQFMANEMLLFDMNGVWEVRNSQFQMQYDAFTWAKHKWATDEETIPQSEERSQPLAALHILLSIPKGSDNDNVLTPEMIDIMQEAESRIMASATFSDHCMVTNGAPDSQILDFSSLDSATHIITVSLTGANALPEDGSMVYFRGTSTVLVDRGRYVMRAVPSSSNSFRLEISRLAQGNTGVNFTSNSDITAGAKFFIGGTRCMSPVSLSHYAERAPAQQEAAICDGFVPSTQVGDVQTLMPICGCPSSAVVSGSSAPSCMDCSNAFGQTLPCTSPRYVEAPAQTTSQANLDTELQQFCPSVLDTPAGVPYRGIRNNVLPTSWTCSASNSPGKADMIRSVIYVGGPVPGYTKVRGESVPDQMKALEEWAVGTPGMFGGGDSWVSKIKEIETDLNKKLDGKAELILNGQFLIRSAYMSIVSAEAVYALGSIWFVWMWVWCTTGSMMLAWCTIFETLVSVPMAMALWVVFGRKFVGFLTIMMLFVILGIGADDVFVMFDAWKQSAQTKFACGEDEIVGQRFAWTFRRAGRAMFVTTITTCFCFLAAGLSEIPSIAGFGITSAFIVFWDWFLVQTFLASAIVVHHEWFERKNKCCCGAGEGGTCAGHMFCCPISIMKVDFGKRLYKQPRFFGLPLTLFMFGVLICIIGAAGMDGVTIFGTLLICASVITPQAILNGQGDHEASRFWEEWLPNKLNPFLARHKFKWLAFFAVIVSASCVACGVGLRMPKDSDKFFKDGHPLQTYWDSLSQFSSGANTFWTRLYVCFGINKDEAIDRSGVDDMQPGTNWAEPVPKYSLGEIAYDAGNRNALYSFAGQQEVINLCDAVRSDGAIATFDPDCINVNYGGLTYARLLPNPGQLVTSGELQDTGNQYYVATSSVTALTDVGNGACSTGVYCFMYDVRDYLVHFCDPAVNLKAQLVSANPGVPEYNTLCMDASGNALTVGPGAFPSGDLGAVLTSPGFTFFVKTVSSAMRFANGYGWHDFSAQMETGVGLRRHADDSLEFKMAFLAVNTTLPQRVMPYSEAKDQYDKFTGFFNGQLSVTQGFAVAFPFSWMMTRYALFWNTIQSVFVALAFCWLILMVVTWNVALGTIAAFVVTCIVAMAGGSMVLMGWSLGIIESIAVIIVIGISVDYSVHIAHAYNVCRVDVGCTKKEEREERSRRALCTIGISIISGLMTSLGSSLFLWFTALNFWRKFGMFLFITLACSFVVAFLLLLPLLMVCAPVQGQCDFPSLDKCRRRKKEEIKRLDAEQADPNPKEETQTSV